MLAASLHSVFVVATVICVAGLLSVWLMPNERLLKPSAPTEGAPQEMA
jgi:hypothetical protein